MRTRMICLGLVFLVTMAAIPAQTPVTESQERIIRFENYRSMMATSPYAEMKWQFLGPTNISGRCTDLAVVSPKGQNYTIYAASASGGVWKTVNEGTSWEPIFEHEATASIGDIALDPTNPEVLWVGTGEANIFRSSQAGAGIYKTTDGGKTWSHMGLANTLTIARIVVHPENSDVVYVAASGHEWTKNEDRGVYKSQDGGVSWEKMLFIDAMTGAIDLVMDPSDPDTLYAATWQRIRKKWFDPRNEDGYKESGIYKTTDAGKSWKPVNDGLPPGRYRGRIGIDIARSNPNVLYAFIDNFEEKNPGERDRYGRTIIKGATVYRSDNKGVSWAQVSGQSEEMKTYMERHSSTFGWVFGQIRVDPTDENTVYTMGLRLNVSHDGGKTFRPLLGMHGDHHGLWIDPQNPNYLVNTNDGGICVSYDRGENWRSLIEGLPAVQYFTLNYDMDTPFRVYGSVQDHPSFRGEVDLNRGRNNIRPIEFEIAPGGEASHHFIDPRDPNLVYSQSYRNDLRNPENTKRILPVAYPDELRLRRQWLIAFLLSQHNPDILYYGFQYLFRSRDRGDTWERISPDLSHNVKAKISYPNYQTIFTLSESPLMFDLIYAGTDDGRLHRTKDGGKTWVEITKGIVKDKWISRVVASQYDIGTVYMTQNGKREDDFAPYEWKSNDFGATWVNITGNIPLGPINVIREDPFDRNILYVGADVGVYVTKDGGKTWTVLGKLPTVYVHDLIVHPRDNMIAIATHGRGVWVMDGIPVNGGKRQIRRR